MIRFITKKQAMKPYSTILSGQSGFMLLEALISMLIFSVGILGIVNLQALSVSNSANNRYRVTASLLADQFIGQMWGDDRSKLSDCKNTSIYSNWENQVKNSLKSLPVVTCTDDRIDITLIWTLPSDNITHKYFVSNTITRVNEQ